MRPSDCATCPCRPPPLVRTGPHAPRYLGHRTADEEKLNAVSARLQQPIGSLGGKVDKVTPPIRRRLAYEIGK